MAGIGFELRKLARKDDLISVVSAYTHSSIASAGPWLFTILALGAISVWGSGLAGSEPLAVFRLIIIYNFAFSLVFSSPVTLVATRLLADEIYTGDVSEAPGLLLGCLALVFVVQFPLAWFFYFHYVDLSPLARFLSFANYFLVCGIWVASIFLTALKDYRAVSRAFGAGMLTALVATLWLARVGGVVGMLIGFSLGLTIIVFSLISRVIAEYPYPLVTPQRALRTSPRYWEVALTGLLYNAAIWVDKWVMWFSPEQQQLSSRMISYPDYDSACFLAFLTIVPSLAIFLVRIETGFFERYQRFYEDIISHAPLQRIERNHAAIISNLQESARNLLVFQGCVSYIVILTAPQILEILGVSFLQLPIFRLAVLGALFHVLFLSVSILLSYFDMRRSWLNVNLLFFVSNALLTWITMKMGFRYYGLGYFLSALLTSVVAFAVLAHHLRDLPYQTFAAHGGRR